MPNIPYQPFVAGSPFTAEQANAIARPVFDGQTQYLGHLDPIADDDLSDDPGAVKATVAQLDLNLKVTAGTGLNALYSAGRALYGTTLFRIDAGTLSLIPSSPNYIYVDTDGLVKTSVTPPPIIRALLSIVTTNLTGVTTLDDRREGIRVEIIKPYASSLRNFGGRGDGGFFLAAGGEVFSDGEYYFTSFTVPVGTTITIDKLARIYCTGNVLVAGTIDVTQAAAGGGNALAALKGSASGTPGIGIGGGYNEPVLGTYNHLVSPIGSGGGGGGYIRDFDSSSGLLAAGGGAGGGCCWIEAAGEIRISGIIQANGANGGNGVAQGALGSIFCSGGGGGGSGGLILLKALGPIIVSGTLSAIGGTGGNGAPSNGTRAAESGSGGGGGRIVIFSPNINTTGATLLVAGGAPGLNGVASASAWTGLGAVGGSYGGKGGRQSGPFGNGEAGELGVVITRSYAPIG